jgi:hypothetical protein
VWMCAWKCTAWCREKQLYGALVFDIGKRLGDRMLQPISLAIGILPRMCLHPDLPSYPTSTGRYPSICWVLPPPLPLNPATTVGATPSHQIPY